MRKQDRLSQRQLVYELKHAIDRVMRRPWDTRAQGHLDDVLAENPRSSRSGHVLYNIGAFRREWLEKSRPRLVRHGDRPLRRRLDASVGSAAPPRAASLPSPHDAPSLGEKNRSEIGR